MKRLDITIKNKSNPSEDVVTILGVENSTKPTDIVDKLFAEDPNTSPLKALFSIDETFWVNTKDDSSFVEAIGFNYFTKLMTVKLSSGTYIYEDFDYRTYLCFVNADSKGSYFNRYLRSR